MHLEHRLGRQRLTGSGVAGYKEFGVELFDLFGLQLP
jgi:hypothetical protein